MFRSAKGASAQSGLVGIVSAGRTSKVSAEVPTAASIGSAVRRQGGILAAVFVFSTLVNALMLTGPLFMLQVYDRVLGSRSEETLVALVGLAAFLFLIMALIDVVRARLMARVAMRVQGALSDRVYDAAFRRSVTAPTDVAAVMALRDLDSIGRLIASPTTIALLDLPFVPVFLGGLFLFHPLIGWFAVAAGTSLLLILALNQAISRATVLSASAAQVGADHAAEALRTQAEAVQGLGMARAGMARWTALRHRAQDGALAAADLATVFASATRAYRLFLQSGLLALGAWLVLRNELTAGAMIATSILLGRALAPIEQASAGWAGLQRAQEGWHRLRALLRQMPVQMPRLALPRPTGRIEVSRLAVTPPGARAATLRDLSFSVQPGQALGVIGPSGAGKTTLGMALTGLWPPSAGSIRLDGAALDQYDADVLGQHLGYLPQRVMLFDGTVAQNIARLQAHPDPAMVVEAARQAGAHDMILALPQGYDTPLSQIGGRLSGGQVQRIGLARALYGDPALLVLDEPDANLDNDGAMALNAAIRGAKTAGRSVIVMAHRPAAIRDCDLLLVLDRGLRAGFGPRDEILRALVRNATDVVRTPGPDAAA